MRNAVRISFTATVAATVLLVGSTASAWDRELIPSPPITTSIDGGPKPMRTRIDVIRLTQPVLKSAPDGAGAYWESRVECEGVGFNDFIDAHFDYRAQGVVRVPASRAGGIPGDPQRAVVVHFHGGYGSPQFWLEVLNVFPDFSAEGDRMPGAPALARGLAYASFNVAGWDDAGMATTFLTEDAGPGRPGVDPDWMIDPETGLLWNGTPRRAGDMASPQTASVGRDLIRASKQAVIAVAAEAGLSGWDPGEPDEIQAVVTGHSFGGFLATSIVLGRNPIRPGVPSGGNLLDPADPASPPVAVGAIPMAPSWDYAYADPDAPLVPMIIINGETDLFFGVQFTVAARYGELLAARGLDLGDRVSLWSLGNSAHCPPELQDVYGQYFDVIVEGDPWRPFVDAALGHILRFGAADGDARRMPASHYDGRLQGDRLVFPQAHGPETELVPFVVDPRWDVYVDIFGDWPPQPLPPWQVADFAAVARQIRPTGHIVGPRMANPIGGYRIDFDGAGLVAPFDDLAQRYGTWVAYLQRSKATVAALEEAGVFVAPHGRAALSELLDPAAYDAFAAQGRARRDQPARTPRSRARALPGPAEGSRCSGVKRPAGSRCGSSW